MKSATSPSEIEIVKNYVCKPYKQAQECPITQFMDKFGGKWKPVIIWILAKNNKMRFGELHIAITGISEKVLSEQLKELQKYDIVERTMIAQIPPKVDYELTKKGNSLLPILSSILEWCDDNE